MLDFTREFSVLSKTMRWPAFSLIGQALLDLKRPIYIIETGSMRTEDNWAGDGLSTRVWDYLCRRTGGTGVSIDINPSATELVRKYCQKMLAVRDDSRNYLLKSDPTYCDLLFLDSYDYTGNGLSELHHAAELSAVYENLPSGCLIAVDDCCGPYQGKQALVRRFFDLAQVRPLMESYIMVWRKP